MPSNDRFAAFLELCRSSGAEPAYVQGAGGNTSIKLPLGMMYVKASGTRLSDVKPGQGYVKVCVQAVADLLRRPGITENLYNKALAATVENGSSERPSMETGFHSVLGDVVLHTHSVYLNVLCCSEEGPDLSRRILPEAAWIPYLAPGLELSQAIMAERDRKVFMLQNHGVIVSGSDVAHVQNVHDKLNSKVRDALGLEPGFAMKKPDLPIEDIRSRILFPDQVVVTGASDALLATRAAKEILAAWGYIHETILASGLTPRFLTESDAGVLLGMDAEQNRQLVTR